jgi:hypothetical protein
MTRFALLADPLHPVFPASASAVRRAYPNVSFPQGFLIDELGADFALYPVTETPAPAYDEATQFVKELQPSADEEGNWATQWSVVNMTEAEAAAYAAAQIPPPNFPGFQQAALADADFQAMIAAALPLAPLACLSLAALLTQVAAGQPPDALVLAFAQVIAAAEPSEAHLLQFIATAQEFHLPEPLIDALLRQHLPEPE